MNIYEKLGKELSGSYFASGQEYEMDLDQAIEFLSLKCDKVVFKTNEDGTREMSFALSDLLFLKSLMTQDQGQEKKTEEDDVVIVVIKVGCVSYISSTNENSKIVVVDHDTESSSSDRLVTALIPPDTEANYEFSASICSPDYVISKAEANKFIESITN